MAKHYHFHVCDSPRRRKLPLLTVGPVTEQRIPGPERTETMNVKLTDTQNTSLQFGTPMDKKGAAAEVQNLEYVSTDPSVASFVAAADGTAFKGDVSAGLPGVCEVYLRGDSDLGDGVELVESVRVAIQVTGGKAVSFGGDPTQGEVTEQA